MLSDRRNLMPLVIALAIASVAAYFLWPSVQMDTPLAAVTVGDFLRIIGTAAVLLVAVYVGVIFSNWG